MLVTINTDASFHPRLKYGAYAFWAISNDFKITKSGIFKSKCINPHDAEIKCIINSIKLVLWSHSGITKIIVNTDSMNAIHLFTNDKKNITRYLGGLPKKGAFLKKKYRDVIDKSLNKRVVIEFRHVKAHSNINDKRSYVNDWCDFEAKKQLKKHISKLKK